MKRKQYFITGLAILLPLALTIVIVLFIINVLTGPFLGLVQGIMNYYNFMQDGFWIFTGPQLQKFLSKILILIFLIFFTIGLGWLTRWVVVHYMLKTGDFIIHRIPFVNTLYITFQDVFKTIFKSHTSSFKQVVIIPFPNPESKTLGLVTKEDILFDGNNKRVAVFVPTTPNPTSGYLLLLKEEDLTYIDISVEEALKYVISCGVILMPFTKISRDEARAKMQALEMQEENL